ncbi:MAG TPA: response regulator [Dehalococcoidia bacterium]|nr:response regulator [Dehalococcoidia bacterium]
MVLLRILIVDDHDDARRALSQRLAEHKAIESVESVSSAREALLVAARMAPHAVVCDVRLRVGEPVALIQSLARLDERPRIIVHAPFLLPGERELLSAAGADAFVMKDAGIRALLDAVLDLNVGGMAR